MMQEKRSIEA
jgi:hypothetical protein